MDAPYVPPVAPQPAVEIHTFETVDISWQCDESFTKVTEAPYSSTAADSALAGTAYQCRSLDEWASAAREQPDSYGIAGSAMDDEFLTFAIMALCEPSDLAPAIQTLAVCVDAIDKGLVVSRSA